jgi:hypothetical protein
MQAGFDQYKTALAGLRTVAPPKNVDRVNFTNKFKLLPFSHDHPAWKNRFSPEKKLHHNASILLQTIHPAIVPSV